LEAGVLLANNHITLEDVRINITDSSKAVPRKWSGSSSYRAALLIGRYDADPAPNPFEAGFGSQNVTVKNCDISFTANNSMIAGIYISNGTSGNVVSIDHNEVAVDTNGGTSAAQALLVHRYDPDISITGNGLESRNTPVINPTSRPAGALLIQIHPDIYPLATPQVSGNSINGTPTYDFYVNILSTGDRTGIPALSADGFATHDSKWMTADSNDTHSFYKKLVETLLGQSRAGAGYGYLAMYLDGQRGGIEDFVWEGYYRRNNRLWAIDFWGYVMDDGAYKTGGSGYADNERARLLIDDDLRVSGTGQFHWTPNTPGDSSNNGLNITPP
jgi:hypothetical protein